jgi:hypothetical protein
VSYHDVLLEFWAAGIKVYVGYVVLPVAGFACTVRLILNVYPGIPRAKK